MNKKFKWLAALLAMSLMLAVLSACATTPGTTDGTTAAPVQTTAGSNGEMPEPAIDLSQFVTVTNYVMGNPPENGQLEAVLEKMNAIFKAEINANMDVQWIEWADFLTKYNLLLASGQAIDMIHASSTWLDLWPNVQRGAFLALDELLPVYAPLTWREIPEEDWEQTKYNGKIYIFPENDYTQFVNHGLYYRGDWLKEFGMEPITNFSQMTEYFAKIAETKEGVIPWDVANNISLWQGYINSSTRHIALPINTGRHPVMFAASFDNPFEVVSPIFDDIFIEYANLMKQWDEIGVWRRDVLNFTGSTRDALRAGTSGSDQHHVNTFRYLRKEMDDLIPGSELGMFMWSHTNGNLVAEPITHGATAIGRNSRNPERAVMMYEMMRQNEEIYHLANFGIEGVQYVIQDDVRMLPEGFDPTAHGFSMNWWGGRVDKFEIPTVAEWAGIRDMWAELDQIVKTPYPYGRFILDRTPIDAELTAISEVTTQFAPAIDFGKNANVEQAVEEYRSRLRAAGIDKVIEEINRQLAVHAQEIGQ